MLLLLRPTEAAVMQALLLLFYESIYTSTFLENVKSVDRSKDNAAISIRTRLKNRRQTTDARPASFFHERNWVDDGGDKDRI